MGAQSTPATASDASSEADSDGSTSSSEYKSGNTLTYHRGDSSAPHTVIWDQHLASLRAYKCRHGDCNVPGRWAEDPRLANWVNRQRTGKKNLDRGEPCKGMTAARAAKLDALGFAWKLSIGGTRDDAGWEAQLAKLLQYKRRHGDCNVLQRWAEDKPLAKWVNNQRVYKKNLDRGEPSHGMTAARAAKLEALGFVWELSAAAISKGKRDDAGWEGWLAKLKAYKQEHGDCNVQQGWAEDPPLGRWVDRQRQFKKALDRGQPSKGMTAARAAKLEALGFNWAPSRS